MSLETLDATMDCSDFERAIDAYLDGEFDDRERAEADAHLGVCARCRAVLERTGALRAALRGRLQTAAAARAPQALRERIAADVVRHRRPLWRRAFAPVPVATLAACAAGALFVLSIQGGNGALVDEAIRVHHRALPLEVDAAALPGWFAGKLDFHPAPPRFGADGVKVEGGRLSNLREWPAAYIRYQLPHGQAGLFIVDDPNRRFDAPGREVQVTPDHTVRVVNARGYNVAIWRENEIVYSLVSDLGEDDLFQLVRTARSDSGR